MKTFGWFTQASPPQGTAQIRLRYPLRTRLEPLGAHEALEGSMRHASVFSDGGLGNAQLKEAPDVVLLAVEQ